jgi:hypothetical protein
VAGQDRTGKAELMHRITVKDAALLTNIPDDPSLSRGYRKALRKIRALLSKGTIRAR